MIHTPMSSEQPTETPIQPETAEEIAPSAPKKRRAIVVPPKAQKRLEVLQSKVEKLSNDNKALKKQLADIKSAHSRIRRIPKPQPQAPAQ